MLQEIERKFKVIGEGYKEESFRSFKIAQGYLSSVPERTVRVRLLGDRGFITVKGIGNSTGSTRFEWEKEISADEAEELLTLCEPGLIEKVRYEVKIEQHIFEVDEFRGDNEGLVIAEIELTNEDECFKKPSWIGDEVTGDERYYNSSLSRFPYKLWK